MSDRLYKMKVSKVTLKKLQNISSKTFHRKIYFSLNSWISLLRIFCSRFACREQIMIYIENPPLHCYESCSFDFKKLTSILDEWNHPDVYCKTAVLWSYAKLLGKHVWLLGAYNFSKKELLHGCSHGNFIKPYLWVVLPRSVRLPQNSQGS